MARRPSSNLRRSSPPAPIDLSGCTRLAARVKEPTGPRRPHARGKQAKARKAAGRTWSRIKKFRRSKLPYSLTSAATPPTHTPNSGCPRRIIFLPHRTRAAGPQSRWHHGFRIGICPARLLWPGRHVIACVQPPPRILGWFCEARFGFLDLRPRPAP